jgi:hypothetical protein
LGSLHQIQVCPGASVAAGIKFRQGGGHAGQALLLFDDALAKILDQPSLPDESGKAALQGYVYALRFLS